jgi:hypothetical protein
MVVNYFFLVVMNACFYLVWLKGDMTHAVDALGLTSLALVVLTFYPLHWRTGLWRLTHARAESLDERQLQLTHQALSVAYSWFTIISLVIMMTFAVGYRLLPQFNLALSVPLAGSLIYLAHTLPGSVLACTEAHMPADPA